MSLIFRLLAVVTLLGVAAAPVMAFSADQLDIRVQNNGDAEITFGYTLSWLEYIAVYLHIADPGKELKTALEPNLHRPVAVASMNTRATKLEITRFAVVSTFDGTTTVVTPALSFTEAEKILNGYWFAPLVQPDFSPATTTVTFPDGYVRTFAETETIPPVVHVLGT
ncbi:MAG: hypothetical protein LUO88_00250 [Methanoregulaceae archaeon]|nr:hypothetical protein [Methanoregulaceae archaeon]